MRPRVAGCVAAILVYAIAGSLVWAVIHAAGRVHPLLADAVSIIAIYTTLAARGKKEEAKFHYQKALELEPSLALAKAALAKLSDPNFGKAQTAAAPPPPVSLETNNVRTATYRKESNDAKALPTEPVIIDPN